MFFNYSEKLLFGICVSEVAFHNEPHNKVGWQIMIKTPTRWLWHTWKSYSKCWMCSPFLTINMGGRLGLMFISSKSTNNYENGKITLDLLLPTIGPFCKHQLLQYCTNLLLERSANPYLVAMRLKESPLSDPRFSL